MRNFLVSLMFSCWLTIYDASAVQHNLFYGNCVYDNNTVPIYKQVVIMENPSAVHVPSKPIRRWYDWFSNIPLRRRAITSAPIVSGKVIDATVVYPPHGIKSTHLIECIQVIDNVHNGYGGFASVIKGGINQNNTEIRLTSQPGGKINSKITIFTYKESSPTPSSFVKTPFDWKVATNAKTYPNHIPGSSQYQKSHYPWPTQSKKK